MLNNLPWYVSIFLLFIVVSIIGKILGYVVSKEQQNFEHALSNPSLVIISSLYFLLSPPSWLLMFPVTSRGIIFSAVIILAIIGFIHYLFFQENIVTRNLSARIPLLRTTREKLKAGSLSTSSTLFSALNKKIQELKPRWMRTSFYEGFPENIVTLVVLVFFFVYIAAVAVLVLSGIISLISILYYYI